METKFTFFFDYIYYRITKAYFKWDGRTGSTALVGITMIQLLISADILLFILRLFYSRNETKEYVVTLSWIAIIMGLTLLFYNYRKYNGTYNKLKRHWQDEEKAVRIYKGLLVIISLILPWIPLILIGTMM